MNQPTFRHLARRARPHGAIGNKPPISLQNTGGAARQPP